MEYTTNTGRVVQAIIYDGTNAAEINALPSFGAAEAVADRLMITSAIGSFYASIGDYVVYNGSFIEIMSPDNFE